MTGGEEGPSAQRRVAAAAQRGLTAFDVPSWFRTLGVGAWLALGIAAVVGLVLFLMLVLWLALAAFFLASGRVGDRTMVLTPDRLTQRAAGVEQRDAVVEGRMW